MLTRTFAAVLLFAAGYSAAVSIINDIPVYLMGTGVLVVAGLLIMDDAIEDALVDHQKQNQK